MKLPRRYQTILFATLMAIFMSAAMSVAMSAMNPGFGPHFLSAWWRGFVVGVAVSTPIGIAVTPLARKLVDGMIEDR